MNRKILYLALIAAAGCGPSAPKTAPIQTATIQRRDIIVTAEATGVIEPINIVEVKSKTASGQVMAMPIDIGYFIKPNVSHVKAAFGKHGARPSSLERPAP